MRILARTGTTLLGLGATALLLTACGDDPEPAGGAAAGGPDAGVVAVDGTDAGAAGTVEEGASPGDADVCALYAGHGQALQFAYDEYGSGGTDDPSAFYDSLDTLAADIDAVAADGVSSTVLGTAQEISASAAAAVPALEAGGGVEEVDATLGGLQTLADTCAELGAA